jgi:UDP-N-acetylglucosamine 2-epimerase (non-hydrolysing)
MNESSCVRTGQGAKILVVFGTRPEAIKMAPVVLALRAHPHIQCRVCVTAQHREMLDQALFVFGITPDIDLDLMRAGQGLGEFTARAIEALDKTLSVEKPDLVLVQGDTTTVLCTALAALYNQVPLGHVEAGLRTGDLYSPWPEEANRQLTSRLARLHFAPTERSRQNLLREGVASEHIVVTGNTVIDALFLALDKVRRRPPDIAGLGLQDFQSWNGAPMVLITGHRRESFGPGFESICRAIARLAATFPQTRFIYPVHLNPQVKEPVSRILGNGNLNNVHLIDPVPYLPFVSLMDRSTLILTDSGGIQEEAPSLGKPVLVMRENTERPEAVQAGTVKLVGPDFDAIVSETARLLTDRAFYDSMAHAVNPYGDGEAAGRIAEACARFFEL